jgi:uncharacterized protein YuzE
MRLTYDTDVDALTIVVSREPVEQTVDVRQGRFIDLDDEGRVVAIEILDASQGFELRDLIEQYDLQQVIEALAGQVQAARKLLHEDAHLRELVG